MEILPPQSPSHTYAASGAYTVALVVTSCGSSDTTTQQVSVILTGLNDLLDKALSVYPNPSTGAFQVAMNMDKTAPVTVSVYNMVGQMVYNKTFGNVSAISESINLTGKEKGIYLLQVTAGENQVTRRIVLE
ncbi:MAG: T9SS type A sorting domain-containing protein [Bacteroidia bacterium]